MENSAMEIDSDTNQEGITRDNTGGTNTTDVTRRHILDTQNPDTRSNTEPVRSTTRSNNMVGELATGGNEATDKAVTGSNNEVVVENPYEIECDDTETLEDLGPELAKMGRILAREITKSLSNALIPLQNEIHDLKSSRSGISSTNEMQDIIEENDRLKTKVDQLELNNIKLKEILNRIEDKLWRITCYFLESVKRMEKQNMRDTAQFWTLSQQLL